VNNLFDYICGVHIWKDLRLTLTLQQFNHHLCRPRTSIAQLHQSLISKGKILLLSLLTFSNKISSLCIAFRKARWFNPANNTTTCAWQHSLYGLNLIAKGRKKIMHTIGGASHKSSQGCLSRFKKPGVARDWCIHLQSPVTPVRSFENTSSSIC
jgi:hypothetical protein